MSCFGGVRRLSSWGLAALLTCAASSGVAQEEPSPEIITEPPESEPPGRSSGEPASEPEPPATIPTPDLEQPKERIGFLRVGGGFGLAFGNDIFFFTIEPQVSYLIKQIVEPGVAFVYQYTRDRRFDPEPDAVRNTVGGRLFTRLYPLPFLFVLVEGELLNSGVKQGDISFGRRNFGNLFLGGGFAKGIGRGAYFAFAVKVNVFRTELYPDNFPIFSIGGGYGF